jgi:hypothetical protein
MSGRHTCDCFCTTCERQGTGAFGVQPDGSAGVEVVTRRPARRLRTMVRVVLRVPRRARSRPASEAAS